MHTSWCCPHAPIKNLLSAHWQGWVNMGHQQLASVCAALATCNAGHFLPSGAVATPLGVIHSYHGDGADVWQGEMQINTTWPEFSNCPAWTWGTLETDALHEPVPGKCWTWFAPSSTHKAFVFVMIPSNMSAENTTGRAPLTGQVPCSSPTSVGCCCIPGSCVQVYAGISWGG